MAKFEEDDDAVAAPAPPPAAAPVMRRAGHVLSIKEQAEFAADAAAVAASLGWQGSDELVLLGITVGDAKRVLCKARHEIHQCALNKHLPEFSAEKLADALGIRTPKKLEKLSAWVAESKATEAAEAAARQ